MIFHHHNVVLPNGGQTAPEKPLITSIRRFRVALAVFGGDQIVGKKVLDLGCLEGGYSYEFAKAGALVHGIEVRQTSFKRCCHLRERFQQNSDVGSLDYTSASVTDLASLRLERHDHVFCSGILYHLANPAAFLRDLGGLTNSLYLHTHVAANNGEPQPTGRWQMLLGELQTHEGYTGRWYREYPDSDQQCRREQFALSSWENRHSFWPLESELERMIESAGFDLVLRERTQESSPDRPARLAYYCRRL